MRIEIPIFTAADWAYRGPLHAMLRSIDMHAVCAWRVVVITDPSSYKLYRSVQYPELARLKVDFVEVDLSLLNGLPVYGHTGAMTYARLLVGTVIGKEISRALYIDADTMARGDISPLAEAVAVQRTPLAGVQECGTCTVSCDGGVFNWREIGISARQHYINAGVMGLDLNLIRETGIFIEAINYLRTHGRSTVSWDQGAINAVKRDRYALWPRTWNFTTGYLRASFRRRMYKITGERAPSWDSALIAHFTGSGSCKPWHVNSISPFAREYNQLSVGIQFECGRRSGLEDRFGDTFARCLRRAHSFIFHV